MPAKDEDFETKIIKDDFTSRRERMLSLAEESEPPLSPIGKKILNRIANNPKSLESPPKFLEELTASLNALKVQRLNADMKLKIGIESICIAAFVFQRYRDLEPTITGIRKIFEILSP
jgi:hypothetical protein